MLSLLLCAQTFALSQLPAPAWLDVVGGQYGCQATLTQRSASHLLEDAASVLGRPAFVWRVVPTAKADAARFGDALLLPARPLRAGHRTGWARARAAVERGAVPVVDASRPVNGAALATFYLSVGLAPDARYLADVAQPRRLAPGTYLVERVAGMPLPPGEARLGGVRIISTAAPASGLPGALPAGHAEWSFLGLRFANDRGPQSLTARLVLEGLPLAWWVGAVFAAPLPAFSSVLSGAFAWLLVALSALLLLVLWLQAAARFRLGRLRLGRRA